jgi:hypothetical protein
MAVTIFALHLVMAGSVHAEENSPAAAEQSGPATDESKQDESKPDEAKPGAEPGEPADEDEPGTKSLEVTGIQCETIALGKTIKDMPPDTRVEAMAFGEPNPVSFELPEQSRRALTECALRASGLMVRVDKTRNIISLLPSGTRSPELPNPKIKVVLKLADGASKPEK